MVEFKESKFYKLLQDFFINNDKETFIQFLAEFYNKTEGIINKNNIQDDLIKELREMFILFNENGIDENIVKEKVDHFVENNVIIQNITPQIEENKNRLNNIGFDFIQQGGVKGEYGNNRYVLQNLINTLNTMGGGTIYIPEGTYYFERASNTADYCIKVQSNVSIRGAGRGRTILKCGRNNDTSLYTLFWNCDQGNVKTNMKFEDFTVDMSDMGNNTTPYSHKGKAFYIQGNTNSVYRDLELIGTPSTALGIDFLNNVVVDNVDCDTCGRLWTVNYTNSLGQTIEGPGGAGIGIGTGFLPVENVKVVNCTCRKCGHFIPFRPE